MSALHGGDAQQKRAAAECIDLCGSDNEEDVVVNNHSHHHTGPLTVSAAPSEDSIVNLCDEAGEARANHHAASRKKKRPKAPPPPSGTADAIAIDVAVPGGGGRADTPSPQAKYREALGPYRMGYVAEFLNPAHVLLDAQAPVVPGRNATRQLKDRQKFHKELLEYQLNLPIELSSSIFVRACEANTDLLRAMITGPEDTPYSNGIFLFDVNCKDCYRQPPKVQFLTTGNGKVRFNPNLYNCGKVCLSLLGK
mmetsp:Transcript_9643/g.20763  ORF Transcript_9643/g.20763 Transcript_9643/m.20763 type:complete len:252 (+) Transcript_9643:622-1377(+)